MSMTRVSIAWMLVGALAPTLAAAQQNVPPKPGALMAVETPALKANKMLAAEAVKPGPALARPMMLVGKEQDLFAGLTLSAQQKQQLQRNLGAMACVPKGFVPPAGSGHVMMQVMPPPTGAGTGQGTAATDECLSTTLDAKQLATLRNHLKGLLAERKLDAAEFERMAPANCALSELKYYLTVLSLL
ncbi:MAG: hypothetical protein U5L03_02425 [Burkholderiaceae bacterium]|nr:hypothetical protein [Burkholderiaceae bacterium]